MLPIQSSRDNNELNGRRTNHVLAEINQHMCLYGYELIDLPIIDSADLFLVKAGDQIINSLFTFDRQGRQLALRPEFTASAADYFAKTQGRPVARWQFAGPVFEDRSHEFSSKFEQLGIGAELIGLGGSLAESEIIAMSASGLDKIGIRDVSITIGHIGLIREIIRQFNLDARTQRFLLHNISTLKDPNKGIKWLLEQFDNQFSPLAIKQIDRSLSQELLSNELRTQSPGAFVTMGGRTSEDIMRRVKLKQQRYADRSNVVAAVEHLANCFQISGEPTLALASLSELVLGNDNAAQMLQEWHNVISLLEADGIALSAVTIKTDLARSWEYYTGIIFELHGNGTHLGGGGRYDELARLVGSKVDIPAVGFAYYGDQLIELLQNTPIGSELIFTVKSDERNMVSALMWANTLRKHELPVQILPHTMQYVAEKSVISVENATTVQFLGTLYQIGQIDLLINELNQNRT